MAYRYKYFDTKKNNKVIFETTQPNHVSDEDVDKLCLKVTGRDPRIERAIIDREIRAVPDK